MDSTTGTVLPWQSGWAQSSSSSSEALPCGQFVLQTLLTEFHYHVNRKIKLVLDEPIDLGLELENLELECQEADDSVFCSDEIRPEMAKKLKDTLLGNDNSFDHLLECLANVAEHALPSILKALFDWHEMQITPIHEEQRKLKEAGGDVARESYRRSLPDQSDKLEKHELAIDFIFCLALISVLPQLSVHPVSDDQVREIENLCFKNFKRRDTVVRQKSDFSRSTIRKLNPMSSSSTAPTEKKDDAMSIISTEDHQSPDYVLPCFSEVNKINGRDCTDLFAEVLGVLSEARFQSVVRKFKQELHRSCFGTDTVLNLISGMRFIKLKLFPMEALQASFEFMQDLANLFLESKDSKDVRHAYSSLICELLTPVAAVINREVNVPVTRNFVEMLYQHTFQLAQRRAHASYLYDLITILLSVSQKSVFLANLPLFLQMCIGSLRNRDLQRISFFCIFRLVWVYIVRIKCESNAVTVQRIASIIEAIFPRGSRNVIPREGIKFSMFEHLIQIIALEKLDYVMKEVIYDLLCVNNRKTVTSIHPERMNIGLNAFLAITDNLERKEGPPHMPGSSVNLPSQYKKKQPQKQMSKKVMTDELAEQIGVGVYYIGVKRALEGILHNLDIALGHILQTNSNYATKSDEEILQGERKQKVKLLQTCVGAIPRILPEGISKESLVELISRLTIHIDAELRMKAVETLKNIIKELPRWRHVVLGGYAAFMQKSIPHTYPDIMDKALKRLASFVLHWRNAVESNNDNDTISIEGCHGDKIFVNLNVLHRVEGLGLVMMCSCRPGTRTLAKILLEELRKLLVVMRGRQFEEPVMEVMDKISGGIIQKCQQVLQKSKAINTRQQPHLDDYLVEECRHNDIYQNEDGTRAPLPMWLVILFGMIHKIYLQKMCPAAILSAWTIASSMFQQIHPLIEHSVSDPGALSRAAIGRSRRPTSKEEMCHWRNLMVLCCKIVPSPPLKFKGSDNMPNYHGGSLEQLLDKSENKSRAFANKLASYHGGSLELLDKADNKSSTLTALELFKRIISLLRHDNHDVQEVAVTALGASNPQVFGMLVKSLEDHLGDILGVRTDTVRRRRRRENLRLLVSRIYELCADNGCFRQDFIGDTGEPIDYIIQYIDHTKSVCEEDKDSSLLTELKFYFCEFIRKMIVSASALERSDVLSAAVRMELFYLFRRWCPFSLDVVEKLEKTKHLKTASLQAMCVLLNAGPISEQDLEHNNQEIFQWLKYLIKSDDKYIHSLGCQVTEMLLLNNPEKRCIIEWVMNQCYTGTGKIPAGCFLALVRVLANCEYPCLLIPTTVVTLYMSAYNDMGVREKATYLLQLIVNRFFKEWRNNSPHKLLKTDSHVMLSRQLSKQHREITLPLFSEVMGRLQNCSSCAQKTLLQILGPWLMNVELVEHILTGPPPKSKASNAKQCTGSMHGSLLVFNNLFWITVKYNLEHEAELQELWGGLMKPQNNHKILLNYVIMLASLGAVPEGTILPVLKKVVMYMCRSNPGLIIDLLTTEINRDNIRPVSQLIEREHCPPYFYHMYQKQLRDREGEPGEKEAPSEVELTVPFERNMMSTSSGELLHQEDHQVRTVQYSCSTPDLSQTPPHIIHVESLVHLDLPHKPWKVFCEEMEVKYYRDNIPSYMICADEEDTQWAGDWVKKSRKPFNPLPLPHKGGTLGPLMKLFPPTGPQIQLLRCNFAVILLTDIVLDQTSYDWTLHLPLLLHTCFLGFDHDRVVVHEHCKKLMLNLIYAFIEQSNPQLTKHKLLDAVNYPIAIDSALVKDQTVHSQFSINAAMAVVDCTMNVGHYTRRFIHHEKKPSTSHTGFAKYRQLYLSTETVYENSDNTNDTSPETITIGDQTNTYFGSNDTGLDIQGTMATSSASGGDSSDSDSGSSHVSVEVDLNRVPEYQTDEVNAGGSRGSTPTEFASHRKVEVHPDVLAQRVRSVLQFMHERDQKPLWMYEEITKDNLTIESAIQLENFLQLVFAAFDALVECDLKKNMCEETIKWAVSCQQRHYAGRSFEIFRCLHQELTKDMLIEVLKTLTNIVADADEEYQSYVMECLLTLDCNIKLICERIHSDLLPNFRSKTDTIKRRPVDTRRHSSWDVLPAGSKTSPLKHHLNVGSTGSEDTRPRSHTDQRAFAKVKAFSLQSFKDSFPTLLESMPQDFSLKELLTDDDLFILTRTFWVCVCLCESDYPHEFSFAIRLLTSVLECLSVSDSHTGILLEKVQDEMSWAEFPGIVHLFLKGVPTQDLCDPTLTLLNKLLPYCNKPVFSGVNDTALPLAVLALLPRLIINYDSPDEFACSCAAEISRLCDAKPALADLKKVMTMYMNSTFPKNCQMWIGAVCKYVNDAYIEQCSNFVSFLVNMLEYGPYQYQQAILKIVYESIKHIYLNHSFIPITNSETLKVLAKFEFTNCNEDQDILKLIISHSSTISLPLDSATLDIYRASLGAFSLFEHGLPELPGRSIQFTVDFKPEGEDISSSQQSLVHSTTNLIPTTNWKKPGPSFRKCRDRMSSLLRISGDIGHSTSIVFSAASDCEISRDIYQSTSSSDSVSIHDQVSSDTSPTCGPLEDFSWPLSPGPSNAGHVTNMVDTKVTLHPQGPSNAGHVTNMVDTAYMADSVTSLPDETSSLIGALKARNEPSPSPSPTYNSLHDAMEGFDFLMDESTADEGGDNDSMSGSWRGGINSYQTHSRDSSVDSLHRPKFKNINMLRHEKYDSNGSRDSRVMGDSDSDVSDCDSRNNTLKRPRSSASPHPSRFSRRKDKIPEAVSDPSSPDGPDTSTPQLLEEIDSPDSDAERPTLQIIPPSPHGGKVSDVTTPTPTSLEYQWLDAVSKVVTNIQTEDINADVVLVFQRVVKMHLLLFREVLQNSIINLSTFLPDDANAVFSDCLQTLNSTEVPFIYIDKGLLNDPSVKSKFRFYMLEAREKVEYLASHHRDVAEAVEGLKRSNQTQLYKLREKLISVCTDIHKLHFQYTALYSTFSKIADMITELRKRTALDLSDLVGDLASRLFQAQLNPDLASLSSSMSGDKSPTRDVTDAFPLSTLPEHQLDIPVETESEVVVAKSVERSEDLTPQPSASVSVRERTKSAQSDKSAGSTKEGLKPKVSIIDKLVSPAKHSKRSKRSHRRGFSEANIGMFRNVELELFDDMNKASSSYNLCTSQSQASLSISSSSPKTSQQTTPQVSPNPSPAKSSILSKSPSEGGFQPLQSSPKAASSLEIYVTESKLQISEDDTVSMTSEIPPPPTPGSECSEKSFDLPLPLPPAEAYYTSPQISRKEFNHEDEEVVDGLIDIDAIQIDITSDNMFNMDSSGDLCMDMMNLKVDGKERQRNTSSNYSDSNSEYLMSSSPKESHARNMSSSSDSSYRAKQKAIPIPNRSIEDTVTSSDFTFYSTNTVTPSMFNSPTNNLYQGIMSTLTTHQIILLINDHIEAHNDTAAIEVLHQARVRHGAYYFGVDTSEDVLCLLGIFCQCLGVNQQGKIALWGHGQNDIDSGNMMANTVMLEQCVYNFASNS